MLFLFLCVCFFIGVPREIYLKTTTTRTNTPFPPPLYFASFHKTPRSKINTKILTLYAPSDPNRIFEGLYGFWRLLFIFTSFGVVWVCSLLSDFYFYHILSVLGLNTVLTNLAFENRKLHMLSVTDDANLTNNFVRNTNTQTLIYTKSKAVSFNYIDKLVSYPYIHK